MGFVLDSSVLIAAEREKRPVSELLASLSAKLSETEFLLSSVTVMELEHGWHRANTPEAATERRRYLDEVLAILPVEPITREMGVLAAKIDADMKDRPGDRYGGPADRRDRAASRLRHRHPECPPLQK